MSHLYISEHSNGENLTNLDLVFRTFSKLLKERFSKKIYTTEDSIRYTLFYSISLNNNVKPHEVILEIPHSDIPGAKVDTFVEGSSERAPLVFEFKYDRKIPSGKNSPRTLKAGHVFKDLFRLAAYSQGISLERFFVYVTDQEMAGYFRNESNEFHDFFDLSKGKILQINESYISGKKKTFERTIGDLIVPCNIECVTKKDYTEDVYLRIYKIIPLISKS